MLELDPMHEWAARALIDALTAMGREAEAVRRYDLFAERLETELGLVPDAETRTRIREMRQEREGR